MEIHRNFLIAVIEDEEDILKVVSLHLKKANFRVKEFSEGESFIRSLKFEKPNLIILDLMLPDIDGLEICKYLKSREEFSSIPIIMLTAKVEETDKIIGLELGADDYVSKPFSPRELVARVKAILRRKHPAQEVKVIEIGDILKINLQKFEVHVNGKKVELTPTEFRILVLLSERKSWVFSRNQILEHLWENDKIVVDRTVDVHIKHLREKLGEVGKFIKSVRGIGYKLDI